VPKGVFNLVNGDGPTVGEAISAPPGHRHGLVHRLDPRRRRLVAKRAAPTVKRVSQELGGKSANIILDDADLEARR
jgi:aldehyde dehydrogenase (NAD+)